MVHHGNPLVVGFRIRLCVYEGSILCFNRNPRENLLLDLDPKQPHFQQCEQRAYYLQCYCTLQKSMKKSIRLTFSFNLHPMNIQISISFFHLN